MMKWPFKIIQRKYVVPQARGILTESFIKILRCFFYILKFTFIGSY